MADLSDPQSPSAPGSRQGAARLRAARRAVIESGGRIDTPLTQLDPRLARSWLRSSRTGLTPEGRGGAVAHASAAQLARALDQQRNFVAHAGPVMEYLFEQTRDSGSMVILADARGMLLHALGDPGFMDRAGRVALRPGAVWHEQMRGTNAIGTTLADRTATVIRGAEHYLDRNAFLSCAAAPILDPGGELLGVLDISGDQRASHPHTLGLVRAGAGMIEQRLFDTRHHDALRLRFHRHAEGIATLTEGLLALSPDGWLLGANAAAREWLGLRGRDLQGVRLDAVFDLGPAEWRQWRRQGDPGPRRLHSPAHGWTWARLEASPLTLEGVARTVIATAALPAVPAGQASAAPSVGLAGPGAPAPSARSGTAAVDPLERFALGDPRLQRAVERARRLRGQGIALLLQGESGVGKEHFAQAWHAGRPGRFVTLRCAGAADGRLDELLAWLAGQGGAAGHTLFLDGVDELPAPQQQRLLLQLIEDDAAGAGGPAATARLGHDVALVASTRRPLAMEVAAGRFREDLLHRLNGLLLTLPPLREREDLPRLLARMLAELSPTRPCRLAPAVAAAFARARWPGNLRQLHNVLRSALLLLDDDAAQIDWAQLPDDLVEELGASTEAPSEPREPAPPPLPDRLDRVTAQAIERVIVETGGNLSEAARRLGIGRATLYRHLQRRRGKAPGSAPGSAAG